MKKIPPNNSEWTKLTSQFRDYYDKGDYAKARPIAQKALLVAEKTEKTDENYHPNVATSLFNLALTYSRRGQYAKAEPFYRRSLAICEKAFGPKHPQYSLLAKNLSNLANAYFFQKKYAKSILLDKQALAIREKKLKSEHHLIERHLNNLAVVYQKLKQYRNAEHYLNRLLSIEEKTLGPNDPDVARTLERLVYIYRKTGRDKRAKDLKKRASDIRERHLFEETFKNVFGADNFPETAIGQVFRHFFDTPDLKKLEKFCRENRNREKITVNDAIIIQEILAWVPQEKHLVGGNCVPLKIWGTGYNYRRLWYTITYEKRKKSLWNHLAAIQFLPSEKEIHSNTFAWEMEYLQVMWKPSPEQKVYWIAVTNKSLNPEFPKMVCQKFNFEACASYQVFKATNLKAKVRAMSVYLFEVIGEPALRAKKLKGKRHECICRDI